MEKLEQRLIELENRINRLEKAVQACQPETLMKDLALRLEAAHTP